MRFNRSAEIRILKPIATTTVEPATGTVNMIVFPTSGSNGDLIEADTLTTTEGPAPTTRVRVHKRRPPR